MDNLTTVEQLELISLVDYEMKRLNALYSEGELTEIIEKRLVELATIRKKLAGTKDH